MADANPETSIKIEQTDKDLQQEAISFKERPDEKTLQKCLSSAKDISQMIKRIGDSGGIIDGNILFKQFIDAGIVTVPNTSISESEDQPIAPKRDGTVEHNEQNEQIKKFSQPPASPPTSSYSNPYWCSPEIPLNPRGYRTFHTGIETYSTPAKPKRTTSKCICGGDNSYPSQNNQGKGVLQTNVENDGKNAIQDLNRGNNNAEYFETGTNNKNNHNHPERNYNFNWNNEYNNEVNQSNANQLMNHNNFIQRNEEIPDGIMINYQKVPMEFCSPFEGKTNTFRFRTEFEKACARNNIRSPYQRIKLLRGATKGNARDVVDLTPLEAPEEEIWNRLETRFNENPEVYQSQLNSMLQGRKEKACDFYYRVIAKVSEAFPHNEYNDPKDVHLIQEMMILQTLKNGYKPEIINYVSQHFDPTVISSSYKYMLAAKRAEEYYRNRRPIRRYSDTYQHNGQEKNKQFEEDSQRNTQMNENHQHREQQRNTQKKSFNSGRQNQENFQRNSNGYQRNPNYSKREIQGNEPGSKSNPIICNLLSETTEEIPSTEENTKSSLAVYNISEHQTSDFRCTSVVKGREDFKFRMKNKKGREIHALCDTGAIKCFITKKEIYLLDPKRKMSRKNDLPEITGAGGNILKTHGIVNLVIEFAERTLISRFYSG